MKMRTFATMFLVAAALLATLVVHAESDRQIQPGKVKHKAAAQIKPAPASVPQRAPLAPSRQGYQLVTDVLDSFGGQSESGNYKMVVNSGGQPSAIGISDSDTLVIEAGFVHAAKIRRGDANSDQVIDLGDIVYLLNYLFKGDIPPCPMEAGDATCNGVVDLGDVIYLLNYLFKGGDPPAC
jgi:hypothetical protein